MININNITSESASASSLGGGRSSVQIRSPRPFKTAVLLGLAKLKSGKILHFFAKNTHLLQLHGTNTTQSPQSAKTGGAV